jgi:hypothetical protein
MLHLSGATKSRTDSELARVIVVVCFINDKLIGSSKVDA